MIAIVVTARMDRYRPILAMAASMITAVVGAIGYYVLTIPVARCANLFANNPLARRP